MKMLVVLTFDVPDPSVAPLILTTIDPPRIPHFAGEARITVDPYATTVERWLDEADDDG